VTAPRPTLAAREAAAFGKVILLGEHAVVHGVPALAAGLPRALVLRARPLDDPRGPTELSIPAWDVRVQLAPGDDGAMHPVARAAAEVLALCDAPLAGLRIDGETTLPAGAGLGSSAALCVALARLALGPGAPAEEVVEASMAGERVFHGSPSGIDSEIAARGGVLRFVRGRPPEPIRPARPLPLVILPTGVPRRTADLVAHVGRFVRREPAVARPILEAIRGCVERGQAALEVGDHATLGRMFDACHGLLSALGVGHRRLDDLCAVARSAGALGAKLTGAGGGGCAIALAGDDPHRVAAAAATAGCTAIVTEIATA